ncbi:MAG: gamma-glutamyltransferase family protein [Rhodobacteraceae bacterium]|nr:gamma-glutamyltransferase family protein [Paracoccaceae bacterium]
MRDYQQDGRSVVLSQNGMCATSHPLAAKVAVNILEAGGNAVDAGIAAAMVLNICEPQMTGLGGDCFALLQPAPGVQPIGLNASGRAPAGLSADRLRAAGHATIPDGSANAVTIPGAVDGFVTLSHDHGKLPLSEVLAPAIRYAEEGVPVAPRVAFDWANDASRLQGTARSRYLLNGKAPKAGQVFAAPDQAKVLRKIAAQGRAGFYEGEVAEDLVSALQAAGGSHTLADFAATKCDYVTPISTAYKGHTLTELPPNGHGATALLMANILAHFDLTSLDPLSAERAHLEAEAAKLAYDARDRFIADPSAMQRLDHLLSPATAASLADLIDPNKALHLPSQRLESVHKETVYLTVVDKDRMALSLIYSVFHSFGSGIASDKFGILLQNRGAGFTLQKGHPNEAKGGKRPMHTIIPGMLGKPGEYLMPFGVMGGQYQPNGHMRFLSNIADYGMDPQAAISLPRSFSHAGELAVEGGYSDESRAKLAALGHSVIRPKTAIGGAQAIRIDAESGVLMAGSDPRKDGCALGY